MDEQLFGGLVCAVVALPVIFLGLRFRAGRKRRTSPESSIDASAHAPLGSPRSAERRYHSSAARASGERGSSSVDSRPTNHTTAS